MPAEKFRRSNSRSGNIGSRAVASRTTNPTSSSTPASSVPDTAGSPKPSRGCSISANTVPASPVAASAAPGRSTRRLVRLASAGGIATTISPQQTTTSGTLTKNTALQLDSASSSPPTSGPRIPAIAPHAVQLPIAAPRSCSEKVLTITASELGTSRAPAHPCTARAATSRAIVGASAHATDATPKPTTPIVNTRRSP